MPAVEGWTMGVKTALAIIMALGGIYLGYLRIQAYDDRTKALEAEAKANAAAVHALERSVIELTVELRTRGVIHAN